MNWLKIAAFAVVLALAVRHAWKSFNLMIDLISHPNRKMK